MQPCIERQVDIREASDFEARMHRILELGLIQDLKLGLRPKSFLYSHTSSISCTAAVSRAEKAQSKPIVDSVKLLHILKLYEATR
jgi:hypothetical protein